MGKTCPTPSLNSSISNSVITNVSSSSHNQSHSNSHHHQHQHQHQHQHHHHHQQQQHHSVPLPPPPPPQSIQPQQQHFPQKYMNSKRKHANNYHNMLMHPGAHLDHNNYLHLNSLWSIWYGVLLTLFQGYLAVHGAYRFLGCSLISWKIEPVAELNLQIVLSGVVFILLPFFFTSAVFKVGNLANDGIKLATGSKERRCSMSPHDGLEEEARGGTLRALWTHGGPTAAFVHIVIAMCLLLPRLLLEARIIENGLLPRENIWQTELDFIAVNRRNLVVLSVVTAPYQNGTGNNDDASNSLDDDQEEDYYNDTMFTAVGSGTTGTNINNNALDILSDSIRGKMATNVGKRIGEGKRKSSNNVGVDFSDGGKTRYFEVPDLINRDSNEEPGDFDEVNNKEEEEDDDDGVSDVSNHKNNNKYEFKEEADIYDGRGAKGGDDDGDGGGVSGVGVGEGRIFVEHFDAKEFWENRPANIPQSTTAKAITTSTIKAATESTDNNNKNYDKMWDKLGTLGKANNFADGMLVADVENAVATTTTNKLSSTTTSNIRQQPETTTTTTASELDRSRGNEAAVTTTITSATATKITTAMGNKHINKIAQNTSTLKTTTTNDSSNYSNNYTDKAKKGVLVAASFTTTTVTPAAHTQPTRTHNHHQHHNHQHHKEQLQSPQQAHTHATHSTKSTRKHHTQNRQHHRQRGGQHHNRRHQNNSGGGATGGRSDESAPSRGSRLDTGRAAADLRTPTAFDLNKVTGTGINLNRLDELDLSAGTTFEQSIIAPRGQNRDSAASFDTDARDYDARRIYTKSTSTISTTTRDSNIHIVKPEKLPEIIPSTPLTSNSKIIEIKTKSSIGNGGGLKRNKRMAETEKQVEIEPEYLVGELSGNDSSEYLGTSSSADSAASASSSSSSATANTVSTARQPPQTSLVRLDGFAGMLQIFFGIEKPIDMGVFEHPPSAEFVNLLFALLVWCVRYPAVFWTTTKSFATIFSIQMIAVAFDIIFSYIGAANLYKLQVYSEAMPIQTPGLILNGVVTLALFLLSSALMISSSMIMYLYGHGRLAAKMRDRSLITMKSSETWVYFAHCASLCYVLACAVVKAPLLNDLSATYKNNLHCPTFLSAVISVAHILLWIVIWLCLTAKHRWTFKLPPMDAYGITKATTQPLLMANRSSLPSAGSVSGSGSNIGSSDQKASSLMSGGGGSGGGSGRGGKLSTESSTDGGTDDVYWPKLTPSSPKLKVTFNEVPSTSDDVLLIGDHEQNDGKRHSPRGTALCFASVAGEIDDGEYATLRTASAATMAGINMTSMSSRVVAKGNIIDPVMTIGCGNETHVGSIPNNNSSTTPTGIYGMKLLHLSEYDELPPPPPQLMPIISGQNSSVVRGDYVNCGGDKGGGSRGGGGSSATGTGSFGDDSTSEEGKLLACVHDDSVTYASTRDLEPPAATTPPPPPPTTTTTTFIADDQQSSAANTHNNAAGVNGLMHTGMMGSNGGDGVVANAGAAVVAAAAASMVGRAPQAIPENMQLSSSPEHLVSPLAPVTVTVHTNEAHIASSSTPRCLRRADSGVPNEALTPRSDTTSTTESTTSPPERAPSESSSGVHSGEERDVEVVIRPRAACKPPPKPPQPAIQEEPYGRCTNMRMSSFGGDTANPGAGGGGGGRALNSATLPLTRSAPEQKFDYANHCSTMPLPAACHSQQQAAVAARGSGNYGMTTSAYSMHSQPPLPPPPLNSNLSSFRSQYANSAVAMAGAKAAQMLQQQQHEQQQQQYSQPQSTSPPPPPPPAGMHTTLPNGVRYSNPHFLRRLPHVTKAAESPYGHLGLGAGHHTFSKLLQDPLQHSLVNTAIPEDRDSANYSMSSEPDCGNLYATAQTYN